MERATRQAGEPGLGKHGLHLGSFDVVRAPDPVIREYTHLDLSDDNHDRRLRELCRQMASVLPTERVLHLVVVDTLVAPDDAEEQSDVYGSAAGLPGAAFVPGSSTSCAAVGRGSEITTDGSTVWHGAGHLLGLLHTTEEDGTEFDAFDDTPECPIAQDRDRDGVLDDTECARFDGRNLMFPSTSGTQVSAQQAAFLRSHPLFHP